VSTGWTADWLLSASVYDIAMSAVGMQNAYKEAMQAELAFAIYNKDNYTFVDKFGSGLSLAVKCFLNADSAPIPSAPDGTTFVGASHTHYLGNGAGFATADIDDAIAHVVEHGLGKGVAIFVPSALIATIAALASTKFVALTSSLLVPANTAISTVGRMDPQSDLNNMLAGYWDGRVPVYTRSWVPAGMVTVVATGAAQKPLVLRMHKSASARGLVRTVPYGMHPLNAQSMNAYVGFGAWNRAAVCVLDTANAAYTEPTLIR